MNLGTWLSEMVTVKEQVALFCRRSVIVQVMMVAPSLKVKSSILLNPVSGDLPSVAPSISQVTLVAFSRS